MNTNLHLIVADKSTTTHVNTIEEFRKKALNIHKSNRSSQEEIEHKDKYCSEKDVAKWILVYENDELVGMCTVYKRNIAVECEDVILGGIGQMRVREDQRKKGIASAIMEEAMKQLKLLHCDIAYLCTDTSSFLARFYGKYGFTLLMKPYTFLSKSGKRYTKNDGMIAPISSEKIYQQILDSKHPFDIGVGNW